MVNSEDDLGDEANEILEYAKNQGFSIFYSEELDDYDYDIFDWDASKDWKEFFTIAKSEGVRVIVTNIHTFKSGGDLLVAAQSIEEDENEQGEDEESLDLKKHEGKVASYRFLWIKDGIRYSISEMTDWYNEYRVMASALRSAGRHSPVGQGFSGLRIPSEGGDLPKELKNKTEDELAAELIEFVKKETDNPELNRYDVFRYANSFWMAKGLSSSYPGYYDLKQRVGNKAENTLDKQEQQKLKHEREKMPELVDQCMKWCTENNIRNATQRDIGAFSEEKELSLTREGARTLWQKVNVALRKSVR